MLRTWPMTVAPDPVELRHRDFDRIEVVRRAIVLRRAPRAPPLTSTPDLPGALRRQGHTHAHLRIAVLIGDDVGSVHARCSTPARPPSGAVSGWPRSGSSSLPIGEPAMRKSNIAGALESLACHVRLGQMLGSRRARACTERRSAAGVNPIRNRQIGARLDAPGRQQPTVVGRGDELNCGTLGAASDCGDGSGAPASTHEPGRHPSTLGDRGG